MSKSARPTKRPPGPGTPTNARFDSLAAKASTVAFSHQHKAPVKGKRK